VDFVSWTILSLATTAAYRLLKKPNNRKSDLDKLRGPTASETARDPIVYGRVPIDSPNCVWYGDKRASAIRSDTGGIGGLLGQEGDVVGHDYYIGLQYVLCRGVVDKVTRIWIDDKPATWSGDFDSDGDEFVVTCDFGDVNSGGEGLYEAAMSFHPGSSAQAVDTYLALHQTPCPAYRHRAYMVWRAGRVGVSTSLRSFRFEVERLADVDYLSVGPTATFGVNPANVAYDVIAGPREGMREPTSSIDLTSFGAAATTLEAEGNGIQMIVDGEMEARDVLREIERQAGGFIYKSPADGKWKFKLARAGASVAAALTEDNVVSLESFRRTTWHGTTNQVNVRGRALDTDGWKDTVGRAHDIANFAIQGRYVALDVEYPGCMLKPLMAKLAARDLAARNRPFASARVVVDRSVSSVEPGDVVTLAWSHIGLPATRFRVLDVDYGELGADVTLDLAEDVFAHRDAIFSTPPDSGWSEPAEAAQTVPNDEAVAQELPFAVAARAFGAGSPGLGGGEIAPPSSLWVGAARQGEEPSCKVYAREGTDPYVFEGRLYSFLGVGTLDAALDQDTASPTTSPGEDIDVTGLGYPEEVGETTYLDADLGQRLLHLVLVDDELMLARSIENVDGTTFTLKEVHRGVLDTARRAHAMGAKVYLLSERMTPLNTGHTQGEDVDVQFRPVTVSEELAAGSANTKTVTMANRARRPYPPTELELEGALYPAGPLSLDSTTASGSGLDGVGLDVAWTRRDYRVFDATASDTPTAGFPADNSTVYRIRATADPAGTPTLAYVTDWNSGGASGVITRSQILSGLDGVIPSRLSIEIETRHEFDGVEFEAAQSERWDVDVTSAALAGIFNSGARHDGVASAVITMPATDTLDFTIGTALVSGSVDVRVNGGGWTSVISAGNTTGTTPSITASDDVEWRHNQTGPGTGAVHLQIRRTTGGADVARGILRV